MKVKELIQALQRCEDQDDEIVFYHLKDYNLTSCELETIIPTELGVELTIEEENTITCDNECRINKK